MINNLYMLEHMSGSTEFLNVLQGGNDAESRVWFDAMKAYPFSSWAFSGRHQSDFALLLRRLIQMRDERSLVQMRRLHFLGVSKLQVVCLYAVIQKWVRREGDPQFQISFDSASPFRMAAKFQLSTGCTLSGSGWSMHSINIAKHGTLRDKRSVNEACAQHVGYGGGAYCASTQAGARLAVGDLLVAGKRRPRLDSDAALALMNHNVEAFLIALRRAERVAAHPHRLDKPVGVQVIEQIIDAVFKATTKDANDLIDACQGPLNRYS